MDKIAVILGAGAANDVANDSRAMEIRLRPPLVGELFGVRARNHFSNILERYEGASLLYDELFPLATAETLNLEAKLQEYATHGDAQIVQAFRHVPPYIRDVLAASSAAYATNLGTYMQLILKLLAHQPHEIAFIVMNYDDLLEKGLHRYARKFSFERLPDYIEVGRQAHVYKLHGSINWLVALGESGGGHSWEDVVASIDDLTSIRALDVHVLHGHTDVRSPWNRKFMYPLITMPLADKGEDDYVCPDAHVEKVRKWLADCDKFLIVGTSGQDADLMALLRSAVKSPSILHYVSLNEAATVRPRFEDAVPQFRFTSPTTWDRGLMQYVNSEEFEQLASSSPSP